MRAHQNNQEINSDLVQDVKSDLEADISVDAEASDEVEKRQMTVDYANHGERLDRVLAEAVAEFSRNYIKQLIECGALTINGKVVSKVSSKVKAGDVLSIEIKPTPQSQAFLPEDIPIDWVYQDEDVAVLNKPAGLVVHPAAGNWSGTLLNALLFADKKAAELPRAGIVHRLDKDTSGLMLVARTRRAMDTLILMMAEREISRQYWCLVQGNWMRSSPFTLDAAIGRDHVNRLRMAVVDLDRRPGKVAQTTIEHKGSAQDISWLECTLHTGRTHQIRVHMSHLGHPLIADSVYRGRAEVGMQRQALHAFHLAFSHPINGEEMDFYAPPPSDLQLAMQTLGFSHDL